MRNVRPNGFSTQWVVDVLRRPFAKSVHKEKVGFSSSTRHMDIGKWAVD